ncbi:MAG: O-antigen ligase family protein [Phormidesmis sp.]
MATSQFDSIVRIGEILRWFVLIIGCVMAARCGFVRSAKKYKVFTWTDRAIVLFLSLFLLSEMWTIEPGVTFQRAISMLLLYVCSFWTLWEYADLFSEKVLIQRLLYLFGAVFLINLLASVALPSVWLAGRLRGVFNNPNNIGLIMGLVIPLAISQWLHTRKNLFLAITIIFFSNLIACGSRTAMLGITIATAVILTSLLAKRSSQALFIILLAAIGIAAFTQTNFFVEHIVRADTLTTASNRAYFWELAKAYISQRPDFGHGFGTDGEIHDYYGTVLSDLKLRGYGVMSSYYGLAIQIGWPFTYCFFGLIWGFVAVCCIKHWRDYTLMTFVGIVASGLTMCIYEPAITSAGNVFSFLFWMILMLAVRRRYYQRKGLSAFI